MLILLAALQLPPAQNFPALRQPGANSSAAIAIAKLCPSPTPDRGALLREEQRISDSVSRKPTADGLATLGCVRANLFEADAVAHEGYLMPSGASWSEAALLAATKAVTLNPGQRKAAELLGVLALDNPEPDHLPDLVAAVRSSIAAGIASSGVLRACSHLSIQAKDYVGARQCATKALAAGMDSSWHLVQLARLSFREADTVSGSRWFQKAAGAAHDSVALQDFNWHLQWFLTPTERNLWDRVPDADREHWLRDHLAERDVRDGQPLGARLAEHFSRFEYVLANFTLRMAATIRKNPRGMVGATPENSLPADTMRAFCEPGLVPAQPFRDYVRWQNWIDDRGVVWLRFGPPEKRIPAQPNCRDGPLSDKVGVFLRNTREVWVYTIDGNRMMLNFESESFTGSTDATRLVVGVLGTYFCDVDPERCRLNELSYASSKAGRYGPDAFVKVEQIERLRQEDRADISVATTEDDNSPRGDKNILMMSNLHRLWDPVTLAPVALVTYAVPVKELAVQSADGRRTTVIDFELRQWDAGSDKWRDTSFARHFTVPDTNLKRPNLVGFVTVASSPGVAAWSLVATQPDQRRGRSYDTRTPGLGTGPIVLSDLVLGSDVQGIVWSFHNVEIPLAPVRVLNRKTPISLYYQIRSDAAHSDLRTTVALYQGKSGIPSDSAVFQVSFDQAVQAGINEIAPSLDVSHLDSGHFFLEVRISDAAGKLVSRRTTPLELE